MKKFISLTVAFALLLVSLIVPITAQAAETEEASALTWTAKDISVVKGRAPRVKELSDGTLGFAFYKSGDGVYFAKSTNGGVSFTNEVKVAANRTVDVYGRLEVQNPNFVIMNGNTIMYTYRCNTFTGDYANKPWEKYYASIRYKISTDGGATFGDEKIAVEWLNERSDQKHDDTADFGFWEPDPVYIGSTLFLYYADTVTPYPEHKPNENLCYQHISYVVWNGDSFGTPAIAQNGIDHNSRDGMSVITKLNDGTYAMVFESTATGRNDRTFVIKMSLSSDGINWSAPVAISVADKNVEQLSLVGGESAASCNPYIITLPDGRVAVSYQTTDAYEGLVPNVLANRHGVQVMISNEPLCGSSEISTGLFTKITDRACEVAANGFSKSACLICNDNKLCVYYEVGNNIDEASATYQDIRMSYIDLSDKTLDGSDIENYHVYSSDKKTVTAGDGQFTMPTGGTTNMIYGKTDRVTDTKLTPVTGLYDSTNYTAYGATNNWEYDSTLSTIKGSGRNMTLLNSTTNMAEFKASVKLSASSQSVWSGIAFHTTPSSNGFRGQSGYIVYIQFVKTGATLLKVEYTNATAEKTAYSTPLSGIIPSYADNKNFDAVIKVDCDSKQFHVEVINDETKATTGVLNYDLDITSTVNTTAYCPSGQFGFTTNASVRFSEIELNNVTVTENIDFVPTQAQNLKASADITVPSDGKIQTGLSFRVQNNDGKSPGLEGYVIKIINSSQADAPLKLQLTRYGTNKDGVECKNLGDIDTFNIISLADSGIGGSKLRLEILTDNSTLYTTVTNINDSSKTLSFTSNLTKKTGDYSNYYTGGGFGIFNHAYAAVISNVSYEVLPLNISNMNISDYDIYSQNISDIVAENGEIVSKNAVAKKIMLKDTVVNDFDADATLRIGEDGNLKGGIIFRADNLGNSADEMTGYSCVLWKNPNTTTNYGRILILIYKWSLKGGKPAYIDEIGRLEEKTLLNTAYPEAEKSLLASAGKLLTLHVKVTGKTVVASFDILGEDNATVLASSGVLTKALDAKTFAAETENTLYNAGSIGISLSTKGSVVRFDANTDNTGMENSYINDYSLYSSNANSMIKDAVNNKLYSTTTGMKQAVINNNPISDFSASAAYKSTTAGATYRFGYDFGIEGEPTTASDVGGFVGYRLYLKRDSDSTTNKAKTYLYLFKFTKAQDGSITRTTLKTVSDDNFFADYATYGDIFVDFKVKLVDKKLIAVSTMRDYPERVINLEYTFTEDVQGNAGWFIFGGGAIYSPSIKSLDMSNIAVKAGNVKNGKVYAGVNAGTAMVGDTVRIVATPNANYFLEKTYYTVGGVTTEVIANEDGKYDFVKTLGETTLTADFALYCDFNKDDKIDATDLAQLRTYIITDSGNNVKAADCNADGNVDLLDLVRTKKYLANPDSATLG